MRPSVLLIFMTRFNECTEMLRGIAHYERTHEVWRSFLDDEGVAETDRRWMRKRKWAGVISRHTTPGLVVACQEAQIPLVDLNDVEPFAGVPKVRPENAGIGHLGAEHFLERGYRNLGFCGFSNDNWSCERRDGFLEATQLGGAEALVYDVNYPGVVDPEWDETQAVELGAWLRSLPKPVGVMACNDLRAFQVIDAAHDQGLLVPEEVAVVGADNDVPRCELAFPPLSSVASDPFQSGYQGAEIMAKLLAGEEVTRMVVRIAPTSVVTRPSTAGFAISDRSVAAALSYIREHACRGITVADVCKHAFASRTQLETKFRRFLDRTPQAEIRRVQLDKTKQLLRETDYPIKRIAEMAGFEHPEYLMVFFKRMTGQTLGAYRNDHVTS
jgi:LacI family transcriptional regulator